MKLKVERKKKNPLVFSARAQFTEKEYLDLQILSNEANMSLSAFLRFLFIREQTEAYRDGRLKF